MYISRKGKGTSRFLEFGGGYMVYWSLVLLWRPVYIGREIRPGNFFYIDFNGKKFDFFCFLKNMAILCRMVNISFLKSFRGPKDQFPAKYHISGHYVAKYGFLKNRIFGDFLMIFLILPIWFVAGIGRGWPERWNIIRNVFLGLFRRVFIPITLI